MAKRKVNKKGLPKVNSKEVKQAEKTKGRYFISEVWQLIKLK